MQNSDKDTKKAQLRQYIVQSKYIPIENQPSVCHSFGLPYCPSIFREVERKRFFEYLQETITTCSVASNETGIPQKYLCQVKRSLQKNGLLQVVKFGSCPLTLRPGVQFITTNKAFFDKPIFTDSEIFL